MPTMPTGVRTNSLSPAIAAKKPGYTPPPAVIGNRPQATGYNAPVDPYAHRSLTGAPPQPQQQAPPNFNLGAARTAFGGGGASPPGRPLPAPLGGIQRYGANVAGMGMAGAPAPMTSMPSQGGYQGLQGFNPGGGSFQGAPAGGYGTPGPQGLPGRGEYSPTPYTPPSYQPRGIPELGSYQPSGNPAVASRESAQTAAIAQRQRELLGPYANFLPIDPNRPLRREDIPLLQAGLIFENRSQSEDDMRRGIDELIRGRASVGNDPTQQLVREAAIARLQNSGGFDNQFMDMQRGLIRNQAGTGLQAAQQAAAADAARRGVGGSGFSGRDMALLEQSSRQGLQGNLATFETQARSAKDEAERAALAQLQGISSEESGQRYNIDQLLANAYLQNQREVPDIMTLLTGVKKGKAPVGGGAKLPGQTAIGFGGGRA